MARGKQKFSVAKKAGLPPGTLLYVGHNYSEIAKITVMQYDEAGYREEEVAVASLSGLKDTQATTWISVVGLGDPKVIETIGSIFAIHPLVLEDILNTTHRPKFEDYCDYAYIVSKAFSRSVGGKGFEQDQISILLWGNCVISFQEMDKDHFGHVRELIRGGKGRIRRQGADYLAYSLLDTVVDNYFAVLEDLGERIEDIEEEVVTKPGPETLAVIHNLKREMLFFRKAIWPLREVIGTIGRGESALFKEPTLLYIRDVYDHAIQAIDTLETYRDIVSGMLDIYLSSISNRMNQIMKVLTIISTIFIPLTFIAGVYGMNFKYMPELEWDYGYPAVLVLMGIISIIMVIFFRTRKWL